MATSDQELNELVVRIQQTKKKPQREALYADLWKLVQPLLKSQSAKLAAKYRLDPDDALSVACEALMAAVDGYRRFNDEGKEQVFIGFLTLIVKRRLITRSKHLHGAIKEPRTGRPISIDAPKTETETGDELGLAAILADASHVNPLDVLAHRSDLSKLWMKLKKRLSQYELQVIHLYCSGITYEASADRLERDDKSIDNALSRIKNKAQLIYAKHLQQTADEQDHCR